LLELKEPSMHDFLTGLVFVAMVIAPFVAALTAKLYDAR
jgi:hypothetical protein